ncbi:MAG: L-histidine N(alpha)-methyltransferase [Alphaproteobacteria bacterium GM202ARS2]|nr:L-histidine N(alpha)-methyltransferase [Alphaproteobacteria bacterium GM202ARS2]
MSTKAIIDRQFYADVVGGLSSPNKTIPSKYLYDEAGSALFERICELDEYYITRSELSLLETCAPHIADDMADKVQIIEFGSGSDLKIRTLLRAFTGNVTYVPIDICAEAVQQSADALSKDFPHVHIIPVTNDFTQPFTLPPSSDDAEQLGFFPGSTIGNLNEKEGQRFLHQAAENLDDDASFLLGMDLQKDDTHRLEKAYDDSEGVTAQFSLNLLTRINRELAADFDVSRFRHRARWNEKRGAVEIYLVSLQAQKVRVGDHVFDFAEGEGIHTETSRKYTLEQIEELTTSAGWIVKKRWIDDKTLFSVNYLERVT